ncbi:hypothetical protein GCM10023165_52510 [Variovorax defluvii]|uniref:Type IV pilin Tt1218-like domain-containing protein n=1 Tax=Variovorax defluvii TaxID=913761 RepID=A0ABP8IFR1_9BURK
MRRGGAPTRGALGIALIEVLVTIVILLFGLLGLAGVSSRANLAEMEAYQRIKALQLVQDMADRLNANRKVANCYSNGSTGVTLSASTTTLPACTTGSLQEQTQAAADLAAWKDLISGQAETQSGTKLGAMIGAVGCVTLDDAVDKVYLVAVSWQGLHKTVAPKLADGSTAFSCGSGAYGDETLHRVVSTKVRIGSLS